MKTTLLAVTGLSPAVVTETIWALAKRKDEPILPERVVCVTTAVGSVQIEEALFTRRAEWGDASVWECMRQALGAGGDQLIADPPRVIHRPEPAQGRAAPLDDILSPVDHQAAAEEIFAAVWDVVRDPEQRLIASIAGGRKTMGALLHAAVSLIGRESDLLTHVLVTPPFDTLGEFFYPEQAVGPLMDREGRAHDPEAARVTLAEVPFVPLRNRFKELDELPGSFLSLRDTLAETLVRDRERAVPIEIDHARLRLTVDGKAYRATARCLCLLEFILRCAEKGETFMGHSQSPQDLAAEAFQSWHAMRAARFSQYPSAEEFTTRQLTRDLSDLRSLLKPAAWQPASRSFVQAPFELTVVGE